MQALNFCPVVWYFSETFNENFSNVVRVLSSTDVYYGDYRNKFGYNNPSSPYNISGLTH